MKDSLKVNIQKFDKALHDLTKCVAELNKVKSQMDESLIKVAIQMSLIRQEIMACIDDEVCE